MSYVIADNLTKSFGSNNVFSDIQFTIEKGEFITLLGISVAAGSRHCYVALQGLNSSTMVNFTLIVKMLHNKLHNSVVSEWYFKVMLYSPI